MGKFAGKNNRKARCWSAGFFAAIHRRRRPFIGICAFVNTFVDIIVVLKQRSYFSKYVYCAWYYGTTKDSVKHYNTRHDVLPHRCIGNWRKIFSGMSIFNVGSFTALVSGNFTSVFRNINQAVGVHKTPF